MSFWGPVGTYVKIEPKLRTVVLVPERVHKAGSHAADRTGSKGLSTEPCVDWITHRMSSNQSREGILRLIGKCGLPIVLSQAIWRRGSFTRLLDSEVAEEMTSSGMPFLGVTSPSIKPCLPVATMSGLHSIIAFPQSPGSVGISNQLNDLACPPQLQASLSSQILQQHPKRLFAMNVLRIATCCCCIVSPNGISPRFHRSIVFGWSAYKVLQGSKPC